MNSCEEKNIVADSNNPPDVSPPPGPQEGRDFDIPASEVSVGSANQRELWEAFQELTRYDAGDLDKQHEHREWLQKYWLKLVLFIVAVVLNFAWDGFIIWMLIKSGIRDSWFHLSDSVLITLASTSTANFLALVMIIAKNLFPQGKSDSKRRRRDENRNSD